MSFSKHANNKANNIYVMGKDYIQKINNTTIYTEKMYYRNFTDPGKKLDYMENFMILWWIMNKLQEQIRFLICIDI